MVEARSAWRQTGVRFAKILLIVIGATTVGDRSSTPPAWIVFKAYPSIRLCKRGTQWRVFRPQPLCNRQTAAGADF